MKSDIKMRSHGQNMAQKMLQNLMYGSVPPEPSFEGKDVQMTGTMGEDKKLIRVEKIKDVGSDVNWHTAPSVAVQVGLYSMSARRSVLG